MFYFHMLLFQFVRQGPVTVTNKQGITRTVTESEIAQLVKNKQQQLQQQKVLAAVAASSSQSGGNTMQNLPSQVFAQAIQQAGTSGTQVATLVKAGGGKILKNCDFSVERLIFSAAVKFSQNIFCTY